MLLLICLYNFQISADPIIVSFYAPQGRWYDYYRVRTLRVSHLLNNGTVSHLLNNGTVSHLLNNGTDMGVAFK